MKLHIQTESLHKKLPFLNHAVSSKSQLPVLLNLLLEAKDNTLTLSATDLEIGIIVSMNAEVEEEGLSTIPAKLFSELIASLPLEKITIQTSGNNIEVIGKKTKSLFQTINADEFPKLYEEKGEEMATIKGSSMQTDFSKVAFSASSDLGRPALSGILIKKESETDGGLLLVATDGYRLSLKHHKTEGRNSGFQTQLIIPSRVIKELILLKDSESPITITVSKESNQVLFFQEQTTLIGRLIEAEFPPYERIIPSDFATRVEFDREEARKAVKVCSIFSRETANIVKLSILKNAIIVSANTPSVGQNTVEVEAKTTGEENEIAFNARYLLDLFSNLEEEQMIFEMAGPLNPGVFKIIGDDSFLHLIMPIRVQT